MEPEDAWKRNVIQPGLQTCVHHMHHHAGFRLLIHADTDEHGFVQPGDGKKFVFQLRHCVLLAVDYHSTIFTDIHDNFIGHVFTGLGSLC